MADRSGCLAHRRYQPWLTKNTVFGNNSVLVTTVYDGNGNVIALVDATAGSLIAEYEYGPFGEVLKADGNAAAENPFRFSTKYQDESGLLYYGYRYYDPKTGRWLSRDPIGERGGLNVYGFVGNGVVGKWDARGLCASLASEGLLKLRRLMATVSQKWEGSHVA